jgi:hypothetical protein
VVLAIEAGSEGHSAGVSPILLGDRARFKTKTKTKAKAKFKARFKAKFKAKAKAKARFKAKTKFKTKTKTKEEGKGTVKEKGEGRRPRKEEESRENGLESAMADGDPFLLGHTTLPPSTGTCTRAWAGARSRRRVVWQSG